MAGRADEADPPAGDKAELAKLKGSWVVTKRLLKGKDREVPADSYTFDGDRLTIQAPKRGKGAAPAPEVFKVTIDTKQRPFKIRLAPAKRGGRGQVGAFKIEKGELFLVTGVKVEAGKDPFSATGVGIVLVLAKEKEKDKAKEKDKK